MVGISIYDIDVRRTIAPNLAWEDVRFPKPVLVRRYPARSKTTCAGNARAPVLQDTGIVTLEHRAFNQRNEEVASCRRVALMLKRPAA